MEEWLPKDKTCVVGIGETEYTRWGRIKRSEFQLACEAILKAIDDAGLTVKDIDGISSFSGDRNDSCELAATLGIPYLLWNTMVWGGGGGGGSAAVLHALTAVATGTAKYAVAFRSLAQGQFGRFGAGRAMPRAAGARGFTTPFGIFTPGQSLAAMQARRHMHEYGTLSRHFGNISVASYKHAQRNPRAVMYGRPITIEDHQNSRLLDEPMHLYDYCQETDGAAAVVITTPERAKDLPQRPVYIMAASQGSEGRHAAGAYNGLETFLGSNFMTVAKHLWQRAGITPKDIDVLQVYENFTPLSAQSIESHGFCKRGEFGPFSDTGLFLWPDGKLPLNTSGGNLAEAYTHGFEYITEAVRQLRGTSTCQVQGAEICCVCSGPNVYPVSDSIYRR